MFDCFLAQMLVLVLIFFCSARIFFLKNERIDSFAVFSPAALIISVLNFFCFDFSVPSVAVFLVALLVFFTNFRSILRLYAGLIVDHYGVVFIIFSIISLLLTLALGTLLVVLRPVKYSPSDFEIIRTQKTLTGTTQNLRIRESFLKGERFSGNLYIYEPIVKDDINREIYAENPVLIFSPGLRATVKNYEPYLMILAQKGFKVMAADFYTKDLYLLSKDSDSALSKYIIESKTFKRFTVLCNDIANHEKIAALIEEEKPFATKKYSALTKLALEIFGDDTKCFYIVDGVDFESIYTVIDQFNTEPYSNAKGFFSMNRVEEYKTSGYGFIEQTDVPLARLMGIERENKFFIPRYVANKTIEEIKK
ncbi:MAG: hypothetical protein II821_06390 [Treponema sp.]|nr:hypothetical protein [Treponema sp.]